MFLLDMLQKYEVRAVFYVLGWLRDMMPELCGEIADRGHSIGSHGYWHGHNEFGGPGFRSPYWDTTPMPFPPSGGFFFRVMPLSYLKLAIGASKVFWLHPHDIDEGHPKLSNVALNWKRHVGLKDSREKLERILEEVAFE